MSDRLDRELTLVEKTAFDTARLVMVGFHQPKKFPEWRRYAHKPGRPRERRQMPAGQILNMIAMITGQPVQKRDEA